MNWADFRCTGRPLPGEGDLVTGGLGGPSGLESGCNESTRPITRAAAGGSTSACSGEHDRLDDNGGDASLGGGRVGVVLECTNLSENERDSVSALSLSPCSGNNGVESTSSGSVDSKGTATSALVALLRSSLPYSRSTVAMAEGCCR